MVFTPFISLVGVTGSMGPFFCEFTLNGDLLPINYPATYTHELAHLLAVPWTFDPKLVEDVQKAAEGFHLFFSCMYHSFDFFINNVAKIMLPCLL